jgi:hypothetical protein
MIRIACAGSSISDGRRIGLLFLCAGLFLMGIGGCGSERSYTQTGERPPIAFEELFTLEREFKLQQQDTDPIAAPVQLYIWHGQILLNDVLQSNIKVFNSDGTFAFAIGRAGDGPGEFRQPVAMVATADDQLAVVDVALSRVSLFGADGAFIRSWSLPPGRVWSATAVKDGTQLLVSARFADHMGSQYEGYALHLFDWNGEHIESFLELPEIRNFRESTFQRIMAIELGEIIVAARLTSNHLTHYDRHGRHASRVVSAAEAYVAPEWPTTSETRHNLEAATEWANRQTWLTRLVSVDSARYVVVYTRYDAAKGGRNFFYSVMHKNGTPLYTTQAGDESLHVRDDKRFFGMRVLDDGEVEIQVYRMVTNSRE